MEMMDRDKVNVSTSQIGFINFLVLPLFRSLSVVMPALEEQTKSAENSVKMWTMTNKFQIVKK